MLKKRLIFTLLYNQGYFVLSRNFRLQRIGDINWLQKNYNFEHISSCIDELIVLDVSRNDRNEERFCLTLQELAKSCFVPISAGGGIRSIASARNLLHSGADKIVLNTPLFEDPPLVNDLASEFGQQCIVASLDVKFSREECYQLWTRNGSFSIDGLAQDWVEKIVDLNIGEIYLNSMDRDGTGQGYDLHLIGVMPKNHNKPVILAGGAGNANHLFEGLMDCRVDAVATANLLNFVGDGLQQARLSLISNGIDIPLWDAHAYQVEGTVESN